MSLTIKQEIDRLSSFLEVVPLYGMKKDKEQYMRMANRFYTSNEHLCEYIRRPPDDEEQVDRNAWTDIADRETNTYLVVDKETREIVFYFSLCCGLLYSDVYADREYTDAEFSFLNTFRQALNMKDRSAIRNLKKLAVTFDLTTAVDGMHDIYKKAKKDQKTTKEKGLSQPVVRVYPGIELTHFVKNSSYYGIPVGFHLKIGAFVFWEYVVPEVLNLSKGVASQYLYLYAADNTYKDTIHSSRLIRYYQDQLKFQPLTFVNNRKMVKPSYDYNCFGMLQDINLLKIHKKEYYDSLK